MFTTLHMFFYIYIHVPILHYIRLLFLFCKPMKQYQNVIIIFCTWHTVYVMLCLSHYQNIVWGMKISRYRVCPIRQKSDEKKLHLVLYTSFFYKLILVLNLQVTASSLRSVIFVVGDEEWIKNTSGLCFCLMIFCFVSIWSVRHFRLIFRFSYYRTKFYLISNKIEELTRMNGNNTTTEKYMPINIHLDRSEGATKTKTTSHNI